MVKRTKGAAAKKRRREAFLSATKWVTDYFLTRYWLNGDRVPSRVSRDDAHAAIDIAHCQCFGKRTAMAKTLGELFTAARGKLPGDSLHERWLQFWAWSEADRPARPTPVSAKKRAAIRQAIAWNAGGALNRGSRRIGGTGPSVDSRSAPCVRATSRTRSRRGPALSQRRRSA